ncbi:MAG: hypothetical protein JSV23_01860 [Promethearchaeota archaeon]|nr:MAG: hypothetical protein JSV23_01860 [Candidatus Lokiarchaeota archaeon]
MVGIIYFYLSLIINLYILIAVYYYCIKTYGIKATIITNICLSSLVLTLIFTGTYSVADLGSDLDIAEPVFLVNDSLTIFSVFIVIFELARFSLGKIKGTDLTIKDIIVISIVVTLYGVLFQFLVDPTAAALGVYYYQNPPVINIFGFPIWFITAFAIYGLYAFIFLSIERHYFQKINRNA